MRYTVRVAGKVFEGNDTRTLIRLAVAARRAAGKSEATSSVMPSMQLANNRSSD